MSQQPSGKVPYRPSPLLLFRYVWFNKPDTKYNKDGVYKADGAPLDGEEAQKFKAEIDKLAEEAFEQETADIPTKDKKKWEVYRPYEIEEDDQGNPTGRIWFFFRQNAVLKVEGEPKPIKIALFDATDKKVDVPVYAGTKGRIMFRPRSIKVASAKQAGVRLDFLKAQIVELANRESGPGGFGAVEGGYVQGEEPTDYAERENDKGANSGDY